MRITKTFLYCLFVLLIISNGCAIDQDPDCPSTKITIINLSEDEKSKVPYHGKDTLVFTSNSGDSLIYFGTGAQRTYYTDNIYNHPSCDPDKINHEIQSIIFKEEKSVQTINFQQQNYASEIKILINESQFVFNFKGIDNENFNFYPFHKQIQLGNKIYTNVSEIKNEQNETLFYNKEYGIIRITSSKIWDIK